jgi:hypothetical protein
MERLEISKDEWENYLETLKRNKKVHELALMETEYLIDFAEKNLLEFDV